MTAGAFRALIKQSISKFVFFAGLMTAATSSAELTLPQAGGGSLGLSKQAERIVTLAPNLAEILFAAGAGNKLHGVVEYSNFPAQVAEIPRVGDAFRIDLERITAIDPDLVIAWHSGNPQTALQKLEQLGIPVWQIEIDRPEEIADAVEHMSIAAGTEETGIKIAAELRSRLNNLKLQNQGKRAVSYFYQVASRPLYTVNGEHIISRGLEICGGQNVFSDLAMLAPQISQESVILANPDIMISAMNPGTQPSLEAWSDWPGLNAVNNKHLFYLPADEISQATPRFLDSIERACEYFDTVRP